MCWSSKFSSNALSRYNCISNVDLLDNATGQRSTSGLQKQMISIFFSSLALGSKKSKHVLNQVKIIVSSNADKKLDYKVRRE